MALSRATSAGSSLTAASAWAVGIAPTAAGGARVSVAVSAPDADAAGAWATAASGEEEGGVMGSIEGSVMARPPRSWAGRRRGLGRSSWQRRGRLRDWREGGERRSRRRGGAAVDRLEPADHALQHLVGGRVDHVLERVRDAQGVGLNECA